MFIFLNKRCDLYNKSSLKYIQKIRQLMTICIIFVYLVGLYVFMLYNNNGLSYNPIFQM